MTHEKYVKRGLRTAPLKGKTPKFKGFLRSKFSDKPIEGNFCFLMDECHCVIDVDGRNGGAEGLKKLQKTAGVNLVEYADTVVQTGGEGFGLHIYFSIPPELRTELRETVYSEYPGVELKKYLKYVVGAGSIHPDTGRPYRFISGKDSLTFVPLPAGIIQAFRRDYSIKQVKTEYQDFSQDGDAIAKALKYLGEQADSIRHTTAGGRNNALNVAAFKLGPYLRNGTLSETEVLEAMTLAAVKAGLACDEAKATIISGLKGGLENNPATPFELPEIEYEKYEKTMDYISVIESQSPENVVKDLTDSLKELDLLSVGPVYSDIALRHISKHTSIRIGDLRSIYKETQRSLRDSESPVKKESFASNLPDKPSDLEYAKAWMKKHLDLENHMMTDEGYFKYNGKFWELKTLEDLNRRIQTSFMHHLPHEGQSKVDKVCKAIRQTLPYTDRLKDPENIIAFDNIAFNLATGKTISLSPNITNRGCLPFPFTPDAQCPTWYKFLNSALPKDRESQDLLQEWFGYNLTWSIKYHKSMVLKGVSRAGKGVISNILLRMQGPQFGCATSFDALSGGNHGTSQLVGKRSIVIGDAQNVRKSVRDRAFGLWLNIASGDPLEINVKHEKHIRTEALPGKITMTCNIMPQFYDSAGALLNRLLVIPFKVSFYNREDFDLELRLAKELPGIFLWAYRGLLRLKANKGKFTYNPSGNQEMKDMRVELNPVAAFFDSYIEKDQEAVVECDSVYDMYCNYCFGLDMKPLSRIAFSRSLGVYFPEVRKNRPTKKEGSSIERKYVYHGIKMNEEML